MNDSFIMTASNVTFSEMKSNRKYFSVSMRMFSTRENLNKCAVTEAFIDDIIIHKDEYVCMGLYADVPKLKNKDYRGLTHCYDRQTGMMLTEQIGSFYDFEKVEDEYGSSLIGYARINKRNEEVCEAICELYEQGDLNFSFEITANVVTVDNGTTIVDVNEGNELLGMAVVSIPAYPESIALDLVAEVNVPESYKTCAIPANIFVSEMDIETVKMTFFRLLHDKIGELVFDMRPLLFCTDCAVMYNEMSGKSYKCEFVIDGSVMLIKDFYEVNYVRAGMGENMDENKVMPEVSEVVAENESENEIVAEEETIAEIESAETIEAKCGKKCGEECETPECEKEKEECDDENEKMKLELEQCKKRCCELEAQVAELESYRAEAEQLRAEKQEREMNAERDEMISFAKDNGLDVNRVAVAEAIQNLDYKAMFAEAKNNSNKQKVNTPSAYHAGYTEMSVRDYAYLLNPRK